MVHILNPADYQVCGIYPEFPIKLDEGGNGKRTFREFVLSYDYEVLILNVLNAFKSKRLKPAETVLTSVADYIFLFIFSS